VEVSVENCKYLKRHVKSHLAKYVFYVLCLLEKTIGENVFGEMTWSIVYLEKTTMVLCLFSMSIVYFLSNCLFSMSIVYFLCPIVYFLCTLSIFYVLLSLFYVLLPIFYVQLSIFYVHCLFSVSYCL